MNALLLKEFNLLWYLSNAFLASTLEASSIMYLLDPFFSPKGRLEPVSTATLLSSFQDCCSPKPKPQSNDFSPELAL